MLNTQVLIIGAGPTGLTLATALAQQGIRCRIIDKLPHQTQTSNALAVQSRTLEVFEDLGISTSALACGIKIKALNSYAGKRKLLRLETNHLPSYYNFVLGLSQSNTEKILTDKLNSYGIAVERSKEFISFKETEDGIEAKIRNQHQEIETIQTTWLMGCDGGHSSIRESLGIKFAGKKLTEHFIMTDVNIECAFAKDEVNTFFSSRGPLAFIPVDANQTRVIAEVSNDPQLKATKTPKLSDFERLVHERMPFPIKFGNPSWLSSFWINQRVAQQFRKNKIFLLGDAAHIHSPFGGQGMNTGIQDAYNLAWKLALIIHGQGRSDLLDSYQQERLPIAESLAKTTTLGTQVVAFKNPLLQLVRNSVIKIGDKLPKLKKKLVNQLSELSIQYSSSQWIEENIKNASQHFKKGPRAGERTPDGPFEKGRLYEKLIYTKFNCLIFTAQQDEVQSLVTQIENNYAALLQVIVIDAKADPQNTLHEIYHADAPSLYLIRPDKYIAFRHQPVDFEALQKFLNKILK